MNRKINTIKSFLNKGDQPELLLGVYSDTRELYSLKIGKLNRYQLFFKDVLISQGVWKQRANLLLLCDKALGYVLSLALGKNEMIGIKIPGELGGPFFTFSSTPQ